MYVSPSSGSATSTRPVISIPKMTFLPSVAASARTSAAASTVTTLTDPPGMSRERALDRLVPCCLPRAREKLVRVLGLLEHALPEERDARRPDRAVVPGALSSELGAQRDQLAHVRNGLHRPRGGEADEALGVQVVAEQENRVPVAGREEARAPVMDEVALVDRLDGDCEARVGERREDPLAVACAPGAERLLPERALAFRV